MTSNNSTDSTNTNKPTNKKQTVVSRAWMVTINNPKIPGDAYLQQWLADGVIVFGCGQLERAPETGTPHHQMYVVTKANPSNKNGFTVKWMKDNIHSTAHLDKRQGTHEQARDYCTLPEYEGKKKDVLAGPWTVGEWTPVHELSTAEKTKGGKAAGDVHKKNVSALLKDVKAGKSDLELLEDYPHLFMSMNKGIEKARLIYANTQPRTQPDIVVLYGPTGTGKSHTANEIIKNNGGGKAFRKGNAGNFWADGYDQVRHPVVWFDEFDGSWFHYKQLLRVTDKWPLDLDTKGGVVAFNPKIIVFTSSKHPKEWYSETAVPDTTELMRRLSGQHGMIKHMQQVHAEPADVGLPLEARFAALLAPKQPVVVPPPVVFPPAKNNPIPVGVDRIDIRQAQQMPIDLTADEPPLTLSQQLLLEAADAPCMQCGAPADFSCDCEDGHGSRTDSDDADRYQDYNPDDDYSRGYPESQHVYDDAVFQRKGEMVVTSPKALDAYWDRVHGRPVAGTPQTTVATHAPPAPRKRPAELTLVPPPNAPASEFKKYKQVPGQAKIVMRPAGTEDDDIDDKK